MFFELSIYLYVKQLIYMKKENKEVMINIRVNEKLRNDYNEYCKSNGYSLSKRIRLLLENDIKNKH